MTTTTPPRSRLSPAYSAPASLDEALRLLQADPSPTILGTLAMPRLLDTGSAGAVLDLAAVTETRRITPGDQRAPRRPPGVTPHTAAAAHHRRGHHRWPADPRVAR
jgi:hypothetical protein